MGRQLVLLFIVAALALTVAGAGSAATTFTDPTGDSGGAPDITTVVVDNDASGLVTFTITIANQADLATDGVLDMIVNTDRNAGTGSPSGGEYRVIIYGDTKSYTVYRWDGSTWTAFSSTAKVSHSPNQFQIVVDKAEMNTTAAFDFYIVGEQFSGNNVVSRDDAPDGTGVWTYTLTTGTTTTTTTPTTTTTAPPTVSVGGASVKAPGLHAGKRFVISAPVTTDATSVKVTCTAKAGTATLHPRGSYAGGKATCSGTLPAGSAGKRLTGAITASVPGAKGKTSFSFPIRK